MHIVLKKISGWQTSSAKRTNTERKEGQGAKLEEFYHLTAAPMRMNLQRKLISSQESRRKTAQCCIMEVKKNSVLKREHLKMPKATEKSSNVRPEN